MADYLVFNESASTVETVAPGAAKIVTLADANLAAALAIEGVCVVAATTDGDVLKYDIVDALLNVRPTGTGAATSQRLV